MKFEVVNILGITLTSVVITCLLACNTKVNEKESLSRTSANSTIESAESIPDSVIQFLITSAATDFNAHKPPTAIDFRNVKAGYILLDNDTVYLICGEFLSQQKKSWISFTTIKTSGYEHYLGNTQYCQDATFIESGADSLSGLIKNKLAEICR